MPDYYLLRHAHVDYDAAAPTMENPLTPLGRQMAERLAERCAGWSLQYLFVSTMRRAQETADAISARIPGLPRLDMGEFAEMNLADMEGYTGVMPSADARLWEEAQFEYAAPRTVRRALAGWDTVRRITQESRLERVAIVAHFGTSNIILRHFMGHTETGRPLLWFDLDWAATCCLREMDEERWVRWINDARHIDDLRHQL